MAEQVPAQDIAIPENKGGDSPRDGLPNARKV